MWFIPLIISFYIFFPFLYRLLTRCEGWYVLLWAAAFEFTYRLISIYWCDGFPIGHEQAFIPGSSLFGPNPLDKLVEGFPFQLQAPFSLFPSRLAEFTLGMIGGISFFNHRFKWIFSIKATLAGFFIWTTGYICVFIDRIGWIFSDFLIALGLILLVVNLARFFQLYLPFLFKKISQLGIWSYYIYLVHKIFIGLFLRLILNSSNVLLGHVMMLLLLVFFTWVASLFLKWIDGSKLLNPFQINR